MAEFTELHSHFLYGIDDGPASRDAMETMLDQAHVQGVTTLYATPHTVPGLESFPRERFLRHLQQAKDYCLEMGYPMTIYPGGEILVNPAMIASDSLQQLPVLGKTSYVLLEFVPDISWQEMVGMLDRIDRAGYRIILAHVERYPCLFPGNRVGKLKERYGLRCQLNAETLLSPGGLLQQHRVHRWLKKGLIDFVASDAHDAARRPFQIQAAYKVLLKKYGKPRANALTCGKLPSLEAVP